MASDYTIILDRGTDDERSAVHATVKANANGWWHHFADAWIVHGKSAAEWRDLVKGALSSEASSVLVLRLPEASTESRWAYFGRKSTKRCQWLHSNY